MNSLTIATPIGPLCLSEREGKIVRAEFVSSYEAAADAPSPILLEAKRQGSSSFTIPFDRQALADYLGVERSAMSAELS